MLPGICPLASPLLPSGALCPSRNLLHHRSPSEAASLAREKTIHVINRILINPQKVITDWPIPRIPTAHIASRRAPCIRTLPRQPSVRELDIVVLVLAGDNDGIGQFAIEGVGVPRVDGGAERICVDGRIANVGFIGVDELDDGEEVLGVVVAILRLCEVEGAGARGVGWWFRSRTGCWTAEAGSWWGCGPSTRVRRRRWHDCVSCGIGAALAPARSVGDGGAGVVGICLVVACDRRC